jgi:hypothetical protein
MPPEELELELLEELLEELLLEGESPGASLPSSPEESLVKTTPHCESLQSAVVPEVHAATPATPRSATRRRTGPERLRAIMSPHWLTGRAS